MKIALDTNVIVSGMLAPRGPPGAMLKAVLAGHLELCFDERILAEYRGVLARKKFALDEVSVRRLLDAIEENGYSIVANPISIALPDPSDMMFVEVAIAGRAEYLVTGNLKDYPEEATKNISVVSPREFLDLGVF